MGVRVKRVLNININTDDKHRWASYIPSGTYFRIARFQEAFCKLERSANERVQPLTNTLEHHQAQRDPN